MQGLCPDKLLRKQAPPRLAGGNWAVSVKITSTGVLLPRGPTFGTDLVSLPTWAQEAVFSRIERKPPPPLRNFPGLHGPELSNLQDGYFRRPSIRGEEHLKRRGILVWEGSLEV